MNFVVFLYRQPDNWQINVAKYKELCKGAAHYELQLEDTEYVSTVILQEYIGKTLQQVF